MAPTPDFTTEDSLLYVHVTQSASNSLQNTPTNTLEYNQIHEQYLKGSVEFNGSQYFRIPTLNVDKELTESRTSVEKQQSWIKKNWGWMITLSNFVYYFTFVGFLCCFSLLFVYLQEDFRSSATETGWVGNLAFAIANLATPFANYLIFKLRSTRLVVFIGVIMCSVGLVSSSFAPNIYYLYGTLGVLVGLGVNFVLHSSAVLLVQYHPGKSCTRAASLSYLGTPVGMLVQNQVMDVALQSLGWRVTLRYFGIITFVLCSLLCLPLIPAPDTAYQLPHDTAHDKEEGDDEITEEKKNCLEKTRLPVDEGDKCKEKSRKVSQVSMASNITTFKSFIMMTTAWITSSAFFLSTIAQSFHNVNFVGHLHVMGFTKQSTTIFTALALGEIVGKTSLGIFGHKYKYPKVYLIGASNIAAGICTLAQGWISNVPVAVAVAALLGFLRSGYQVLVTPALVDVFGITRIYDAAAFMMLATGVAFLVGSIAMGTSYDYTGSYLISIILAMCLFTVAGVLFILIELRIKCTRAGRMEKAELQQELEIVQVVGMDPTAQQLMPWPSVMQLDHTDDPEHNGSTFIVHVGDAVTVVDVDVEPPTQV